MALFFNRNSDPVHLNTPYSHNSGPIVPGIKSTGAQEPGASRSVFGSWLRAFSWDEIGFQNGPDFYFGTEEVLISSSRCAHPYIPADFNGNNFLW